MEQIYSWKLFGGSSLSTMIVHVGMDSRTGWGLYATTGGSVTFKETTKGLGIKLLFARRRAVADIFLLEIAKNWLWRNLGSWWSSQAGSLSNVIWTMRKDFSICWGLWNYDRSHYAPAVALLHLKRVLAFGTFHAPLLVTRRPSRLQP